jgi:hypothetical protein
MTWEILSTNMRTLEALEMGGRDKPKTRWTKEDLPTPVEPMMAMLKPASMAVGGCDYSAPDHGQSLDIQTFSIRSS